MLTQMQNRFKNMSENIVGHIDEMGNRIEELEKSIAELVNEASVIDEVGAGDNKGPHHLNQPNMSDVWPFYTSF